MKQLIYLIAALTLLPFSLAYCFDYDNGVAPYQYGFIETSTGLFPDYCNHATGVVTEMYCLEDTGVSKDIKCLNGCNNIKVTKLETLYPLNFTYWLGRTSLVLDKELGYCFPSSPYLDVIPHSYNAIVIENPITNETPENETNETEPECYENEDCQEGYECVEGSCQEIIEEPDCYFDSDCPPSKHCIDGSCQFKHCNHDWQCERDEGCFGHHCQDVVCGFHKCVWNHGCVWCW